MTIREIISSDKTWSRAEPSSPNSVDALLSGSGLPLPQAYLTFLELCNGGEGELPVQPLWFQIWPAQKVLEYNHGYEVEKFLPGFVGFGSNGGGELLAFDTRQGEPWPVVAVPFIPMEESHAVQVAPDFHTLAEMFGEEEREEDG